MLPFTLSSSSTDLESLLLSSPKSPRTFIAGRLSYPAIRLPSSLNSPQLESDIGLQSPTSLSDLSAAQVTYSDLVASSHHVAWPSTSILGAGPRVTVPHQEDGGKSSNDKGTSGSTKRPTAPKRSFSNGWCASILQVLASPQTSNVEGVEICPIDIFNRASGVGLGLGLTAPLSLVDVPRSTDEYTLIPIKEVAPGSLSRSSPEASSPHFTASSPDINYAAASPSPIATIPVPTAVPTPATAPQTKYEGLGHGLPSHMRDGARMRLPSIPEEVAASAPTNKVGQHAGLGLGLPSSLRNGVRTHASEPSSSPRTLAPLKSRLQSTVHDLFSTRKFPKRNLFSIPEVRSPEMSAGGHPHTAAAAGEEKGKTRAAAEQQQRKPTPRPQMSPVMLLAAQSVLEEDRKFRKKEGLDEKPMSSTTVRLASQVLQAQEEQTKFIKQAGLRKASPRKFRFLF
ncbi:hypothetical protein B0H19DRAFT_1094497 [Mycena capillaripes]|nr:hypothetical protein B0H19DRAFT_1094497 [Mycena capillaripes]